MRNSTARNQQGWAANEKPTSMTTNHPPDHRARQIPAPHMQERLWSLCKAGRRIDCELFDHGSHGVEVQLVRDGHWYSGLRFTLRAQALAHADLRRDDLERHGWREDAQAPIERR
jgi:hypothetical protein